MRVLLIAGVMAASGCLSSNHPFHTPKDAAFDESLVGQWGAEGKAGFTVAKAGKDAYEIVELRDGKPGERYKAVLFALNGKKYLNISPPDAAPERERNNHFVWKLETDGKNAVFTRLSESWINETAKRGELTIKHEAAEGKVSRITASSEDLRAFLIKHGDEPFKTGEGGKLTKLK